MSKPSGWAIEKATRLLVVDEESIAAALDAARADGVAEGRAAERVELDAGNAMRLRVAGCFGLGLAEIERQGGVDYGRSLLRMQAEARAEGEAKATAKLHDLLSGVAAALDPDREADLCVRLRAALSCDGPGPCQQYEQDLAEAEKRGAERERWECRECVRKVILNFVDGRYVAGLRRAMSDIAARGPMRGPEEAEEEE